MATTEDIPEMPAAAAVAMFVRVLSAPIAVANAWVETLLDVVKRRYPMRRTSKVALCGIVAALSVLIMFLAYFPYFTYAVPAAAGLLMIILVIEINPKWAVLAFISSSILILLLAETEAKLMYVLFFGYYPILKERIERMNKPVIEYILKFSVFNIAVIAVYLISTKVFGIPFDEMGDFGQYLELVLLILANITFAIYDFATTRLIYTYMIRLHPRLKKLIK